MGKIAFVFPGQGAQHPGMGLSLSQNAPSAGTLFRRVDQIRPSTSELCFHGTMEVLSETKHTQPCMFACELAAAFSLQDAGISPDMVAGFSLGELAALTFAGCVSLDDGFRLVSRRGELMQADAESVDSAMAAVLKLDSATVERLCAQFDRVYPVNYNCPGQITISCLREELPAFSSAVKAAGGRALPLKVRGGFHSPFMQHAAGEFAALLEQYTIASPRIPLYSNYTALPYEGDFSNLLAQQIPNPVRWEDLVRHMIAQGTDCFVEVGPGNVLTGLIKKIDSTVRTWNVSEYEDIESVVKELCSC